MVKGSTSQTSTNVPRGGRASLPTGGSGAIRRRTARGGSSSSGGRVQQSVVNFYTEDSPGIKIQPYFVVIMSLAFIGFVTLLHVIGKIRGA